MNSITVRGPLLANEKPLWEATVDLVNWRSSVIGDNFTEGLTVRHLFLSQTEISLATSPKLRLPGTMLALCQIKTLTISIDKKSFRWAESANKICHSLLILQADPSDWKAGTNLTFPDCVCLEGEIDLSRLSPPTSSLLTILKPVSGDIFSEDDSLKHSRLRVNASGLLFDVSLKFHWNKEKIIQVPVWMTPFLSKTGSENRFYLTLDRELMNAERDKWLKSVADLSKLFQELADLVRPKEAEEYWASLILPSSSSIPSFFWSLSKNEQILNFPSGEWRVVVADQKPGQSDVSPRGLLTMSPSVSIRKEGSAVTITFSEKLAGYDLEATQKKEAAIALLMIVKEAKAKEKIEIRNLLTEYETLPAADILRQQYQLTPPTELFQETDPAILWGNMVLADGWAQLPFLNLTEQHYFDALPQLTKSTESTQSPLLVGAAVFGNDAPKTFDKSKGEHPWSISILDGKAYKGEWKIDQNVVEATGEVETILAWNLEIYEPDLVVNGFLLLGTQTTSQADLLPSLDNFLADIKAVSLRTAQPDNEFPAPFQFNFLNITFLRNTRVDERPTYRKYSIPDLQNWQFSYQINTILVNKNIETKTSQNQVKETKITRTVKIDFNIDEARTKETTVEQTTITDSKLLTSETSPDIVQTEPKTLLEILLKYGLWSRLFNKLKDEKYDKLWQIKPIVWRRHPQAPLIQALPLTQTQMPPSYPSPSRQLAPFQIGIDETGKLIDAIFGSPAERGAKDSARWLSANPVPLKDWTDNQHLPLASLGLPGLIFDPNSPTGLLTSETVGNDFLPAQLSYSLRYTDEINALAQLPKDDTLTLLPDEKQLPPAKPILIPRRESYSAFWQQQSEKAALARVDADSILMPSDQGVVVANLIGELVWPVQVNYNLASYPGSATFIDVKTGNSIQLVGKVPTNQKKIDRTLIRKVLSLQGITGSYDEEAGNLRLRQTGPGKYNVVAGSTSAVVDNAHVKDQRGRQRGASVLEGDFIKTPFIQSVDGINQQFDLWTLLKPEPLHIEQVPANPATPKTWLFWFLNLPVNRATALFNRKGSLSDATEDVNDPLSDTSGYGAFTSRLWGLYDESRFTTLLGFDFFPLTLEKVELKNNRVHSLELIGRIQLPLANETDPKPVELPELGNAVRVTFARDDNGLLRLKEISSSLDEKQDPEEVGIWPLSQGEPFAPCLHWNQLTYNADTNTIHLECRLAFFMFGARWLTNLLPFDFLPNQTVSLLFNDKSQQDAIRFETVTVKLTETLTVESIEAILRFQWGNKPADPLTATANLTFDLVKSTVEGNSIPINEEQPRRLSLNLPGKDVLVRSTGFLTHNAIQLGFTLLDEDASGLSLLPGMQLVGKKPSSGFAVMSFTIEPTVETDGQFRSLIRPNYGSLEVIFLSEWGEDLSIGDASLKRVFGSSAGTICAGYTLSSSFVDRKNEWKSSLLLNGVVSLTSLVTYPTLPQLQEPALALCTVRFAKNSSSISESDSASITKLANLLGRYSNVIIRIEGHTDDTTGPTPNPKLSKERAESTKAAFGDTTFTFETNGFGAQLPIEDNTSDGQKLNRRAEIYLARLPDELKTFLFNENADQFESDSLLKDLAHLLLLNPAIQVRVEGHATERQSPAENKDLSVRRAVNIRLALLRLGLPADRIIIRAFGQTQPLALPPEAPENRRVGIHLFYNDPGIILFDLNESKLNREGLLKLKRFADLIPANSALTFSVEGHTDSTGTVDSNKTMSRRRAETVKARLLNLVPGLQLIMAGFGETLPVAEDSPETGNVFNRRVEIHSVFSALPAVKPAGSDLNHVRHRIRILFNQHEVPAATLATGDSNTFFSFNEKESPGKKVAWQFLATVEHQLVDVAPRTETEPIRVSNDRRWTVVQEIRMAHPQKFVEYFSAFSPTGGQPIKTTFPALKEITTQELSRVSSAFHFKPFLNELLQPSINDNQLTKLGNVLVVEASTIQQVLNAPIRSDEFVNLQYLPGGVQQAILSIAEDFAMPVTEANTVTSEWSLLALPFLGRLQPSQNDQLDEGQPKPASLLAIDPILFLLRNQSSENNLPELLLALTSRGDKEAVPVNISRFDLTRFRRFKRLDPATLLESWFRLQHLPVERKFITNDIPLVSVTAALPADSPSRLSREALLHRLFSEQRETFPPSEGNEPALDPGATAPIGWRRNALLTWQGLSNLMVLAIDNNDKRPYSFYFVAAQLQSLNFGGRADQTNRYPAVTLLPANLKQLPKPNERPVSFTISPYLGIGYLPLADAEVDPLPELVFAELLCLDQSGKTLISIASRLWQQHEPGSNPQARESWAKEMIDRIASDSALAVLRVRTIFRPQSPELRSFPRVAYSFQVLVSDAFSLPMLEGTSPLRQNVINLRFTEAHFRPGIIPKADLLMEYAPPQVDGVQPIYIDQSKPKSALTSANSQEKPWHWGTSGLRFTVSHTKQGVGIIGETNHKLWWNSFGQRLQFAYPPTIPALLPAGFRAKSILSLLPAAHTLPLPTNLSAVLTKVVHNSQPVDWQPVLPGSLTCLSLGGRAGAFYSSLHRISSQTMKDGEGRPSPTLTSGGFSVQYRVPRPVTLPQNPTKDQLSEPAPVDALQTWASYFEPRLTLKACENPYDNAFVAVVNQGHGIAITLSNPPGGILPHDHDGIFSVEILNHSNLEEFGEWTFRAELLVKEQRLALQFNRRTNADGSITEFFSPQAPNPPELVRALVGNLPHGTAIRLYIIVTPPPTLLNINQEYSQTLLFPLRLARTNQLQQPYQYRFIQFEDPEYNRQLVSNAAQNFREVTYQEAGKEKRIQITIASDRRDYNSSSEGLVAILSSEADRSISGKIRFTWITSSGIEKTTASKPITSLYKFAMNDIQNSALEEQVKPGDSIMIKVNELTVSGQKILPPFDSIQLRVEIVKEPVTPVPQSAYALLRRNEINQSVECVRFAWAPQPARIELLTPFDLITGVVRRRAIFQWIDTLRSGRDSTYTVQKITSSGSTAFNVFK